MSFRGGVERRGCREFLWTGLAMPSCFGGRPGPRSRVPGQNCFEQSWLICGTKVGSHRPARDNLGGSIFGNTRALAYSLEAVTTMRKWQTIRTSALGRHVHKHAYAALVLSGCYEEAGDLGCLQVRAGDVVLHDGFEAHLDRFSASGAKVLNVSLPARSEFQPGLGRIDDPDSIVRMAEKNEAEAAVQLLSLTEIHEPECRDWPDELAADLLHHPSLSLSRWSEMRGVAPWTLSRGFAQVFDISPSAFRVRARTRHAWKAIRSTNAPLAHIAVDCGFADQSHMTRSIKSMTGRVPRAWRDAANRFKTQ